MKENPPDVPQIEQVLQFKNKCNLTYNYKAKTLGLFESTRHSNGDQLG